MSKIDIILGLFLGIIISSVLYLVFYYIPDSGFYYFLIVSEKFFMALYLTIGLLVGIGILSIVVLLIIFRKG